MKGVKSKNPHPSSYRTSMVAEGSFLSNFAIIANLSLTCITRKSNFQYLIIHYGKNYYNTN